MKSMVSEQVFLSLIPSEGDKNYSQLAGSDKLSIHPLLGTVLDPQGFQDQ
jgi:hypothetical protein